MINFPQNPALNQVYTFGAKSWKWNGRAWDLQTISDAQVARAETAAANASTSQAAAAASAQAAANSVAALHLADYTALRTFNGNDTSVYVTGYLGTAAPSGIAGMFVRDDSDTTTADNGGTVIVASNGKRWKRRHDGVFMVRWWGAGESLTDDTAAIQSALNAAKSSAAAKPAYGATVLFHRAVYTTTSTITIPLYVNLLGETVEGVIINALFNGDAFTDELSSTASTLYFTRIEELSINKSNTDGSGNTTGKAINFHHNASVCSFRRLRLYGGDYAIYSENLGYSLWNSYDNVFMDKQAVANVYLGQGSNATMFYGCQFHGAPIGLDAPGQSVGVTLTACDFESYTTCAIRTDNGNIKVIGGYNEFKTALYSSFIINGTGTIDVIGAYMKGAGAGYLCTLNGNGFVRFRNCDIIDFSYSPPFTGTYSGNFEFSGNNIGGSTVANAKGTEKGTFIPVLTFATPGDLAVAYSTQVGRYTKVGNRITLDIQIVTSSFSWTTAASYLRITGIPYPGNASTGVQSKGSMSFSGITKASYTQFSPSIDATNRQQLIVFASGSGVSQTTVNAADLPSGSNKTINLSITYEAEW